VSGCRVRALENCLTAIHLPSLWRRGDTLGYIIGLVHQLHTRVQQLADGGNNAKTEFGAVVMLGICKGLNLATGFQRNALQ
jgi:hypothetical protein